MDELINFQARSGL